MCAGTVGHTFRMHSQQYSSLFQIVQNNLEVLYSLNFHHWIGIVMRQGLTRCVCVWGGGVDACSVCVCVCVCGWVGVGV